MKKNNTIKLPNTLPHLIHALWHHPDCPTWLQDLIWDGINDRCENTEMTPTYWASQLESCRPDEPGEHDRRYGHYLPEDEKPRLRVIDGGVQ